MNNTLTRKGWARIYVAKAEDVARVESVIMDLDAFEHGYMPTGIVAPFSEYPKLVYTHKFDGLDMTKLTAVCWKCGIYIWVCDNGYEEYLVEELIKYVLEYPQPTGA